MKLPLTIFTILLAGLTAAHAQPPTWTPDQVGDAFCIATLANDMSKIEAGLLSPALVEAITVAETRNAEYASQYPDDKPPLGDGLPWRSYPDAVDGCTVGAVTQAADGASASVAINYSFKNDPTANYTDTLQLKQTTGTDRFYQIDDIEQVEYSSFTALLQAMLP
ncbi:MAG: hypothetical protein ACOH2M_23970 [Cypionkella sp.]